MSVQTNILADVLCSALTYLPPEEICATRAVCKAWRAIGYDALNWVLRHDEELFPSDLLNYRKVLHLTYKAMFSASKRLKIIRAHELDGRTLSCVLRALGQIETPVPYFDFSGMPRTDHKALTEKDVRAIRQIRIQRLRLNDCGVRNARLFQLSHMTSVTELTLSNNCITSIQSLEAMRQLEELDVSCNSALTNVDIVASFTNLQRLFLSGTTIAVLPDMSNLTALHTAHLGHNIALTSLAGLKGTTSLTALNIDNTYVTNLRPLQLSPLTELSASESRIDETSGLETLTGLTRLNLEETPFGSLRFLERLPLKFLDLNSCRNLRDFAQLRHLTSLEYIDLSETNAPVCGPLSLCPRLVEVYMKGTPICDIGFFREHTKVEVFDCRDTLITAYQVGRLLREREAAGLEPIKFLL